MGRRHHIGEWKGQYIGDWLIIDYSHFDNEHYWLVRCRCGLEEPRRSSQLRLGRTSSCRACAASKRESEKSPYWKGSGGISYQYLNRLQYRHKEVTVTMDDLISAWESQEGHCIYSGVPLSLVYKDTNWGASTASIDRRDSTKGYIPGNIQWVHKQVNKMKMDIVEKDFLEFCCRIADHRGMD